MKPMPLVCAQAWKLAPEPGTKGKALNGLRAELAQHGLRLIHTEFYGKTGIHVGPHWELRWSAHAMKRGLKRRKHALIARRDTLAEVCMRALEVVGYDRLDQGSDARHGADLAH